MSVRGGRPSFSPLRVPKDRGATRGSMEVGVLVQMAKSESLGKEKEERKGQRRVFKNESFSTRLGDLLDVRPSPSQLFSLDLQAEKTLKRRLLDLPTSFRRRRSEESESRERRVCDEEKDRRSVIKTVSRSVESRRRLTRLRKTLGKPIHRPHVHHVLQPERLRTSTRSLSWNRDETSILVEQLRELKFDGIVGRVGAVEKVALARETRSSSEVREGEGSFDVDSFEELRVVADLRERRREKISFGAHRYRSAKEEELTFLNCITRFINDRTLS